MPTLRALLTTALLLSGCFSSATTAAEPTPRKDLPDARFRESDSHDERWQLVDLGPFHTGTINYGPGQAKAVRGIAVRVGEARKAAMLFDEEAASCCAAWQGDFLKFSTARFGLMHPPQPGGLRVFSTAGAPGWGQAATKYKGLYLHQDRVVFSYTVDGVDILETPWLEETAAGPVYVRTLEVAAHERPLSCLLAQDEGTTKVQQIEGLAVGTLTAKGNVIAAALPPKVGTAAAMAKDKGLTVTIAPATQKERIRICLWAGKAAEVPQFAAAVKKLRAVDDVAKLTAPAGRRWGKPLATQGRLGSGAGPYVVDTLTLPFENPYHALLFTSGHDFFADGRAAVCTAHGDVWLVSGIDEKLEHLTWQRFATGLYQPLGLRIVKDQVYVLCRDQIVRLHDLNGDGEADFYECFNHDNPASPSGHDYAACLETDTAGNFYYLQSARHTGGGYGVGGVYRVSADGSRQQLVGSGFRNAIGLGVGGGDIITAAPQEGEWTPASAIFEIKPGGFYGFGGPQVTPERPLGYDSPLLWMARAFDNSSGGQVWAESERWGPLNHHMIQLSYGRCWPLLILRDVAEGVPQGAAVKLGLDCDSGIMRGRVHPRDGQLYVSGLRGWQTSAAQDGCLQRLRYTGAKCYLPTSWHVLANGITVGFAETLDRATAEDPGNYDAQQWNYRYRPQYGSPEFKVSDPGAEGRDPVAVRSATLLADGKTVFVELDHVAPVMQLLLRVSIKAADGAAVEHEILGTVNRVPATRGEPGPQARAPQHGGLPEELAARLQPGLLVRFEQPGSAAKHDCRVTRLAALAAPLGASPAAFLQPRTAESPAFTATFAGYLQAPVNGDYRFQVVGSGNSTLTINEAQVDLRRTGAEPLASPVVRLVKGYNHVAWTCRVTAADDAAALRLLWSGKGFTWEPIPPTSLTHDAGDEQLAAATRLRDGRELFATRNCHLCHHAPDELKRSQQRMPELEVDPPTLSEAAARIEPGWLFQWILDPAKLRTHTTMPRLLRESDPAKRHAQAADLVAYVATLGAKGTPDPAPRSELAAQGEVLYENLGCIACHRFTPPTETDAWNRVSLHYMAAKYVPAALATYIRSPHRHHSGSRMPDLRVSATEAEALAAYVLREARGKVEHAEQIEQGDARRGQGLFVSLGCKHCHNLGPTMADELRPAPQATLTGCLDAESSKTAPDFDFTTAQRTALRDFLAQGLDSLVHDPAPEYVERAMREYQCGACHNCDGNTARWPRIVVEEGARGTPPELLPPLTWAGEKLKTRWLEQLFAGELRYRARPWLAARMPAYANGGERLAAGFALSHGMELREPVEKPNLELAELGRQLTLKQQGLDCRQCHGLETLTPKQDNNAQGISFLHMPDRLRHGYYERWLRDPLRIDPGAKMPKFAADGEHTTVKHILDGDANKQFEALWQYIQAVPQQAAAKAE